MSLVFHPGDEISDFVKRAYTRFFPENVLNPRAFPSLRRVRGTPQIVLTAGAPRWL